MNPKLTLLALFVLFNLCSALLAQTINRNIFTTNGPVNATAQKGDTLYIGGSFSQLGYGARSLVRYFSKGTKPDFTFTELERYTNINAVEPDGNGGYYLAGNIPSYYGVKLENGNSMAVIHIHADNSLDPDFTPTDLGGYFGVSCLKKQGDRIYIGGHFYTVNGVNHRGLAALNATTGRVVNWFPETTDDIDGIEAADSLVFVYGYFFTVGNHDVEGFTALQASNGKYVRYYSPQSNTISKLKINNNKLYMGGVGELGYNAHGIAKISSSSAQADKKFPETNGSVNAILPDGKGGYYIGGSFSLVNNTPITNFAHVLSDGKIDPSLNLYFDDNISCLTTDGTSIYIGGNFTRVNNVTRRHAVAVSLQYGKPTPWNPDPDSWVSTMLYSSGVIYMGGSFQHIKGESRSYAGAVTVTNTLTNWAPEPDLTVNRIISNASGTSLFICGAFTHVKGKNHPYLSKVNTTNGNVAAWNPQPNYNVDDLVLNGSKLFIGGEFQMVHGQFRSYLAEIDTASNNPTDFTADLNSYVYALIIFNGKLYVGGNFFSTESAYCARVDLSTKTVDTWQPDPNYDVYALVADETGVVIGGTFSWVNETQRNSIAVIDLVTNELTPFNLQANAFSGGQIGAFAFSGNELFVGGHINYENENGTGHYGSVISLDTLTGSVTRYFNYSPDFYYYNYNSPVYALTVSANKLYVGGAFSSLYDSGQSNYITRYNLVSYDLNNNHLTPDLYNPNATVGTLYTDKSQRIIASGSFDLTSYVDRANIAAINLTTGRAINWNYFPDNEVEAMAIKDTTLFIGGTFTRINNSDHSAYIDRAYVAALSTKTGKPTIWNADADGDVKTLWIGDSILFAGGNFTNIKGLPRNYAAAVGTGGTGTVKDWAPGPDNTVFSIVGAGNKIYLGGYFTKIKGFPRNYLASVDKINGTPDAWKPNPDDGVFTLAANSTTLYVGGSFKNISTQERWSVAAYTIATRTLTPFNPELKSSNIYFPAPSLHSLAIYGQTLFMGSDAFNTLDSIKGAARYILGAADTLTGNATPFNPWPNAGINHLNVLKNKLLIGGQYTSLTISPSSAYFSVFDLDPLTTGNIAKKETAQPSSDSKISTGIGTNASKRLSGVLTPNPAKDLALLNISGNESDVNITITDMLGKVLWQLLKQNVQQVHIPVQTFAQGMYLLTIRDRKQSFVIKFLKTQ
jgi:hypothetical protein